MGTKGLMNKLFAVDFQYSVKEINYTDKEKGKLGSRILYIKEILPTHDTHVFNFKSINVCTIFICLLYMLV